MIKVNVEELMNERQNVKKLYSMKLIKYI